MNGVDYTRPAEADIILNCITEGIIAIRLDQRVSYVNKAAADLLGYNREEIIGQFCEKLLKSDICSSDNCILRRTLRTKEAVSNYEMIIKNREEKPIPVSVNTALQKDAEGNITGIIEVLRDISQIKALEEQLERRYHFDNIIGKNERMQEMYSLIPSIAQTKSTVLIEGESGTGKELIARAIHANSLRKEGPFVKVNCGALAEGVLESELFGHVKGAFTGAYYDKPGRFELADKGTIFLDEIGDISPSLQVKLLRVLQEEEFERVGGTKSIKVDVRIIAATNRDLYRAVKEGHFRDDLFYRLRVIPIQVPPLRERKDDIPILINHFINKFNGEMKKNINNISPKAMEVLLGYDYPGNVRELENIIEHAFVCCHSNTILIEHLPKDIFKKERALVEGSALGKETLQEVEKELIVKMLTQSNWRYKEASERLGISRTTLWRKIKEYGLTKPNNVS